MICGSGSSVGIATDYGLDGPGIESRWGARFSAPVQTGPGAHPASCTMGTGLFPGVKSGRGVKLTPHAFLVTWSWKGRAIPLSTPSMGRTACTQPQCLYKGDLYLYIALHVSRGSSTHHREHITVHTVSGIANQYCCLLLSWMKWNSISWSSISSIITTNSSSGWQYMKLYVQLCAPDDERRNRLKHVEHLQN